VLKQFADDHAISDVKITVSSVLSSGQRKKFLKHQVND